MSFRLILVLLAAIGAAPPALAQEPAAPAPAAAPVVVTSPAEAPPAVFRAEIVATYPHDAAAFTQGLVWHDGALFESTGREGQSGVREVALDTGEVVRRQAIPADQFGEGLALWDDQFVSLTWRDGAVHRWDAETLEPIASRTDFPFEGWGLATSEEGLIHSDGSDVLRVLEGDSYAVLRTIPVTLNGRPLRRLNELEMIDGLIFANVWESPFIVAIDPADGVVRQIIDLRAIVATIPMAGSDAVLNGIAWDADKRRLFVTGKLWPSLFEIRLVATDAAVR